MKTEAFQFLDELEQWKGSKDFDLDAIRKVLRLLGDPQEKLRIVHVAGTNGKGSVSLLCAAGLGSLGYSVGLTISPHLVSVRERIIIDGHEVSTAELAEAALQLKRACEKAAVQLSRHEGLTALAFLIFAENEVDYAVVEVGLGGRLDSTNVISRSAVSVITTIGLDHVDILGPTVSDIAREKAGIIKERGRVVVGRLSEPALGVVRGVASLREAKAFVLGEDFYVDARDGEVVRVKVDRAVLSRCTSPLRGEHQLDNLAVALQVVALLGLNAEKASRGMATAFWPARVEEVKISSGRVLLDCAHNPEGIAALLSFIRQDSFRVDHLTFGALETKNWRSMVRSLRSLECAWSVVEPDSTMAVSRYQVAHELSCLGISSPYLNSRVEDAVCQLRLAADRGDQCLVAGSIYLVGAVREHLGLSRGPYWEKRRGIYHAA